MSELKLVDLIAAKIAQERPDLLRAEYRDRNALRSNLKEVARLAFETAKENDETAQAEVTARLDAEDAAVNPIAEVVPDGAGYKAVWGRKSTSVLPEDYRKDEPYVVMINSAIASIGWDYLPLEDIIRQSLPLPSPEDEEEQGQHKAAVDVLVNYVKSNFRVGDDLEDFLRGVDNLGLK